MLSKKSAVPFRGTKEQEEELLKVIEELKDEKGALMPIMQRAQDIYGICRSRSRRLSQTRRESR